MKTIKSRHMFYLRADGKHTRPHVLRFLMLASMLIIAGFTSSARAAPTVVGNTITWPDDGWYQVDNKLTREIECQGGTECTVLDGIYWVNRFNEGRSSGWRVIVGKPPELNINNINFADTLSIDGNSINWTVGGWYQVQDGYSYQDICNGTDYCTVPRKGEYVVINHSLGLRTRINIAADTTGGNELISDDGDNNDTPITNSVPTVVGNTITWPDDGWYQVDNKLTREIECQGGRQCTVADGIYWVNRFNDGRSSGWRIIVGDPPELNIDSSDFVDSLSIDGYTINWSVGGWYQVQDGQTYQQVCNGTDACTVPRDGPYIVINHSLGLRTRIEVAAYDLNDAADIDVVNETISASQVTASLELVADRTFRISWQSTTDAEFYRVLENSDGVSGFNQISDDLTAPIQSFDHRVALYSRVNARYIIQACTARSCQNSDEMIVSGSLESAVGYFKASNTDNGDEFGRSVTLSADGKTLAIGSHAESSSATGVNGNQDNNGTANSGAVYVFALINDVWQQQGYLKASNPDQNDFFGWDVSLSGNGNTLAIGAFYESSAAAGVNGDQNDNSATYSGAVYVFQRSEDTWQQQDYLKASNAEAYEYFGWAVNLSSDGNTLAVGANFESSDATDVNSNQDNNSAFKSGAVYVFEREDGNWQQQAYLKASNTGQDDEFGFTVSLSANGDTLAIGARREKSAATGINGNQDDNSADVSGAVYVFKRTDENWHQQAYLKASNASAGDYFGYDVSLSADGNTLAVGAVGESSAATGVNGDQNNNNADNAGAVYVFMRLNENWQQQNYLKASNTDTYDRFGNKVSLSADGNTLAVGAYWEDSAATGIASNQNDNSAPAAGAVYVFAHSNGSWQQQAYLKASNTDSNEFFGQDVALSSDGKTLAVGAIYEDSGATGINGNQTNNSVRSAGAVYLY
ncbi:FG-GAP repeat protein [Granulosicoccus sp.]|nr:FG-GAP repeat protein [Granulosicoccus sp.]MDB4223897.1 FG-GAP repeat protein [Granulosicoccus sp.]